MFERRHPYATLFTIAILLGMVAWFAGGSEVKDIAPYYLKRVVGETATVRIVDYSVKVEVARTVAARRKGLSGRDSLALDKGMLFVFHEPAIYPFTMQNTRIPLDIIWILDGTIVYIAHSAQPGEANITPEAEANYVLEVNGGVANGHRWTVGNTVAITFDK